MSRSVLYAGVIIPRPLEGTFTYAVPAELAPRIAAGKRVIVPFGGKKFLTGIVESLSPVRPADVPEIKSIERVLDDGPVVVHPQIKLWRWMADYYMCPVGDVMKAALPSGLKIESETVVAPADAIPEDIVLDEADMAVMATLRTREKLAIKDLERYSGVPDAAARAMRLVEKGFLRTYEALATRYRSKVVKLIAVAVPRGDREALERAFAAVKRSPGQEKALLAAITLTGYSGAAPMRAVERTALIESAPGITAEHVAALARKGLISVESRRVSRFQLPADVAPSPLPQLSDAQQQALTAVHKSFMQHGVTLLHGVTSSGKTEVYMHLIDHVLQQGRQVLFLVPEIALTTQLTRRLQRVFGSKVRIYHSRFSDNERVDIWRGMIDDPSPCVVIGARSAVFLPLSNLGLVIVDEEHDPSYKQADPAPRYNGRDTAIMLASMHGAKTLLGSATPAIDTYYKATEGGKYGLVELTERYGAAPLPSIDIVDMAREREAGAVHGPLADVTTRECRHALADGRQIILFHGRRGYSPRAFCRLCRFIPRCDHCDVALTYHRRSGTLECHYCGAVYPLPRVCPNCHEPAIEVRGYGTERVEDEIAAIFPDSPTLRMDLDTTRNKDAYANIIDDFSAGKARILIGTQMVTKGLDFSNVAIVGVVNADSVLHHPDFRAGERAFNLLEQVAGRAGRRSDSPGKVIIQSYTPEHPVLSHVAAHDYAAHYAAERAEREQYMYPPFARIINIYIKHRDRATAERISRGYAERLRAQLGNRVNGPVEPPVGRVASLYIRRIMLRVEISASHAAVRAILRRLYIDTCADPAMRGLSLYYDVDPV
ncbi:MAG: primosomal protein N' [Bacteroides sp.]|nr:primosomal protein N' [Bacteroides sp.]MCM1094999.1 primosomal protein N' [Terasakiella sp.]